MSGSGTGSDSLDGRGISADFGAAGGGVSRESLASALEAAVSGRTEPDARTGSSFPAQPARRTSARITAANAAGQRLRFFFMMDSSLKWERREGLDSAALRKNGALLF